MTAATLNSSLSPTLKRRDKIGLGDLAWLVWRQHRVLIAVTSLAVLATAGLLWWDSTDLSHASAYPLLTLTVVPAAAGVFAVFLGAPLLPAEYERGTHLVVWSQDVTPGRWLLAKVGLLGTWLIVLFAILGAADTTFIGRINGDRIVSDQYGPWGFVGFESWIPLQIVYALFGFALGLAVGALIRRMVVSMVVTMVVFTVVRLAVGLWRPTFLAPLRYTVPPPSSAFDPPGVHALKIGYEHTVDVAGNQVPFPSTCYNDQTNMVNTACAKSHGLLASYVDYQPASRLPTFHWIEFGIYAVLAVALLSMTAILVRKVRVR
ncbi:MAG TPA: hypothetical protein VHX38_12030 [Pseudonocardiaceae bacterium]|jgi:hypothetical protein|nr:hypothetical protein [Pseudonocardiaceae bacterium]